MRQQADAARKLLQRAEQLFPRQPETHYNLAVLESQAGRFHEAVLEANQALTLAPDNLEVLRFLGVLYFENQVCNEAVRYFRRVLAVSPTDTDVRIGLASCLHEQGHSDEAVQELESAMSETPRDYDLLLLMANIRLEQNRLDDALRTQLAMQRRYHTKFSLCLLEVDAFRELVRSWAEVKDRSAAYCVKPGSSMTW